MKILLLILAVLLSLAIIILAVLFSLVIIKALWVLSKTFRHGKLSKEKKEIIHRANYLVSKIRSGEQLIGEMPNFLGNQFQGEWALYTSSMTAIALSNIACLYPEKREWAQTHIKRIIDVTMSPKIRDYDKTQWHGEDPLDSLNGNRSHITYLSHLAWMIGRYKHIGGDDQYDSLYNSICEAMNRRILQSPILNLPSYPGESIYVPDMLVAIVALAEYARANDGKYKTTVDKWIQMAEVDWIDKETGMLASYLSDEGLPLRSVRGSYSALNCSYLSLVDQKFAKRQYELFKSTFKQRFPVVGIKEFIDRKCMYGWDVDAGPILFNLSPSGTAFAIGCATTLGDNKFRKQLLRTAEIAGSTVTWNGKSHYLLANFALVGEAVALAMRTALFIK